MTERNILNAVWYLVKDEQPWNAMLALLNVPTLTKFMPLSFKKKSSLGAGRQVLQDGFEFWSSLMRSPVQTPINIPVLKRLCLQKTRGFLQKYSSGGYLRAQTDREQNLLSLLKNLTGTCWLHSIGLWVWGGKVHFITHVSCNEKGSYLLLGERRLWSTDLRKVFYSEYVRNFKIAEDKM